MHNASWSPRTSLTQWVQAEVWGTPSRLEWEIVWADASESPSVVLGWCLAVLHAVATLSTQHKEVPVAQDDLCAALIH